MMSLGDLQAHLEQAAMGIDNKSKSVQADGFAVLQGSLHNQVDLQQNALAAPPR